MHNCISWINESQFQLINRISQIYTKSAPEGALSIKEKLTDLIYSLLTADIVLHTMFFNVSVATSFDLFVFSQTYLTFENG